MQKLRKELAEARARDRPERARQENGQALGSLDRLPWDLRLLSVI